MVVKVFKYAVITIVVRFREVTPGHILAKPEVVKLLLDGFGRKDHSSQRRFASQLTKHPSKKLVSTREVFDTFVSIVLLNYAKGRNSFRILTI